MTERRTLPVLPLRGTVLFPGITAPIGVGRKQSLAAVEEAAQQDNELLIVAQRDADARVRVDALYEVGVVARIVQMTRAKGGVQLLVEGLERVRVLGYHPTDSHLTAVCLPLVDVPPPNADDPALLALRTELEHRGAELAKRRGVPEAVVETFFERVGDSAELSNLVVGHMELSVEDKQAVLETTAIEDRLRAVLVHVERQMGRLDAQASIQSQVQEELGERQREMFLREQLKAIQKELGDGDEDEGVQALKEKLAALQLPEEARAEVDRELGRWERAGRESAEAQVIRTYLEWVAELPWGKRSEDRLELEQASELLDGDHHGLDDVKDRVLEFLAVRKLKAERAADEEERAKAMAKGPILLFAGPPGVGKTSIGKSIARALGREYVRIALGGVRDEADIRGHRRTYVGAMPGRIIQGLKQAKTQNPVFLLDEVDKLGASYQGNPQSALLEVLDPAQNDSFTDHYLNVPFDLSEVLFIATANFVQDIPGPLLDRMEVVEFSGYTEGEKAQIARRYLIPRQLEEAGLTRDELSFADDAIAAIVSRYTRESGVRQLERTIGSVARKLARRRAGGEVLRPEVSAQDVSELLGRPKVRPEQALERDEVGVATGMYYTPAGGDIMFVEASIRRLRDFTHADTSLQVSGWGNVSLILTGQLGDVMKESARAALTYAAGQAQELGVSEERLGSIEAHIHVPAGAIPKDGPSAGVAMTTALVSAMLGRPVRKDVAMTGEITLRGRVLPIGGVKEKVLGAHRAGVSHIVLPKENERDLEDIPREVLDALQITCASTLAEVLDAALVPPAGADPSRTESVEAGPSSHMH